MYRLHFLKLTNIAPENRGLPKRKQPYSNHPISGAESAAWQPSEGLKLPMQRSICSISLDGVIQVARFLCIYTIGYVRLVWLQQQTNQSRTSITYNHTYMYIYICIDLHNRTQHLSSMFSAKCTLQNHLMPSRSGIADGTLHLNCSLTTLPWCVMVACSSSQSMLPPPQHLSTSFDKMVSKNNRWCEVHRGCYDFAIHC